MSFDVHDIRKGQRCSKIWLPLKRNHIKYHLLKHMIFYSRAIYNSCVYFQRQMFYLREQLIEYYIINFDKYYKKFSLSDSIYIINYISKNRNELSQEEILKCKKLFKKIYIDDLRTFKNSIKNKQILNLLNEKNLKRGKSVSKHSSYKNIKTILEIIKKNITFPIHFNNRINNFLNDAIEIFRQKWDIFNSEYSRKRRMDRQNKRNISKKTKKKPKKKTKKQVKEITTENIIIPMFYSEDACELYIKNYTGSYKQVYSQVAQQTIRKVISSYKSYFASIKSQNVKGNIHPPNYLEKNSLYNLIFQNNSFKIIKNKSKYNLLRLSVGKYLSMNYNELQMKNANMPIYIDKNKYITYKRLPNYYKYLINNNLYINNNFYNKEDISTPYKKFNNKRIYNPRYIYFKLGKNIKNIKEVEIVPIYNGYKFCMILKYNIQIQNKKHEKENLLSIDLGITNIVSLVTSTIRAPLIFGNKWLLSVNKYFNNKIDKLKSILEKINGRKTSKQIKQLFIKRENVIMNYMHNLSRYIINYCKRCKITRIIIGYNTNWKNKVNMNRNTNRKFYEIPFRKLIDQIFYKGEVENIIVEETNEAYTSKVDSLSLEKICHHEKYKGKRIKRGLFKSNMSMYKFNGKYKSKKKKILINADINGALNIMRKYINKYKMKISIRELIKQNIKNLLNPIKKYWKRTSRRQQLSCLSW